MSVNNYDLRRIICFPEPLNLLLTIFLPLSLSRCYYKFACALSLLYFWIFIINYSIQLFDHKLLLHLCQTSIYRTLCAFCWIIRNYTFFRLLYTVRKQRNNEEIILRWSQLKYRLKIDSSLVWKNTSFLDLRFESEIIILSCICISKQSIILHRNPDQAYLIITIFCLLTGFSRIFNSSNHRLN